MSADEGKETSEDHLCLAQKPTVLAMLAKKGDGDEKIIFSDLVIKINRKGKEQSRCILITNKAVYNLAPSDKYNNLKRRIPLDRICAVTKSTMSNEFVLNCPEEYDYRMKSSQKDLIASVLETATGNLNNGRGCAILEAKEKELNSYTITKEEARLQSREDRHNRRKLLLQLQQASDDEKQTDGKTDQEPSSTEGDDQSSSLDQALVDVSQEKVSLQDFELLKVLGRGSFGKVMQVRKKSDGKIYAMKILRKKAIIDRNQVEHTQAERRILQTMKHPFLMNLRYAFQNKEKLYFVLDYFEGGELFFHLKQQSRFDLHTAKVYVAEIACALGHLHENNIIYRDLKPENILLSHTGHLCLTDFGLSKDLMGDAKATTFCGTPEYLAPEIIMGVGHDKAVDWWSLGILLYELTVGMPPFYSQNVKEMYKKIQFGVLRFPSFLTDECKLLIVALLNRDPKKRLGSVDDLADIKAHPFFEDIDWQALVDMKIQPTYTPDVAKGESGDTKEDTSNFDAAFTNEPVVDSVVPDTGNAINQADAFGGFTFGGDKTGKLG